MYPVVLTSESVRPRSAFSRRELVVVISINGVLGALTVALVKRVREQAKIVICTNHLRQIATAFAAYAADNNGAYPPAAETVDDAEENQSVWSAQLVARRYLSEPTGKENAVFVCPFDPAANDPYVEAYRCYAYNCGVDETDRVYPAAIEDTANTIMLAEWFEPDPFASTDYHPVWDGEGWCWRKSGGLYAHHSDGKSNVLFYDLHVEPVKAYAEIPAADTSIKWSFQNPQ